MVLNSYQKIFIATGLGAIFFISAISLLALGHPQEDAYILFQYSKKLAAGEGIVFDRLSGPIEGATDFLWMLMLATASRFGLDLATSAAFLNALGLGLTVYVILEIGSRLDWSTISGVLLILFSGGVSAALGGFSTLAYGGLFAVFALSLLRKRYKLTSFLTLVIPLFRPDGFFLVFGGILTVIIFGNREEKKSLLICLSPAILAGLIYFVLRYKYFESFLPLPLLVKSNMDSPFEGLYKNFAALRWHFLLLIPLALQLFLDKRDRIPWATYSSVGFGAGLLFLALAFVHQSQNVAYRFQYPIVLSFIIIYTISATKIKYKRLIVFFIPVLCIQFGARVIYNDVQYLTGDDYMHSFPQLLKRNQFEATSIAITEAGRFPFWFDSDEMIDLIGLNSKKVVNFGALSVLNLSKPELIFIHQAGRLELTDFQSNKPFFIVEPETIRIKSPYLGKNPVYIAPEAALKFASDNDYIAIPIISGGGSFYHLFFISKKLDLTAFISILEKSFHAQISYYDSLGKEKW